MGPYLAMAGGQFWLPKSVPWQPKLVQGTSCFAKIGTPDKFWGIDFVVTDQLRRDRPPEHLRTLDKLKKETSEKAYCTFDYGTHMN